tara:strand:- start:1013 stop:2182 length:1170 start_codon:yes stop_codon:yes gene_type:complete
MEKKKVIEALNKNDEPQKQFNELLQLFIKHPHHGPSLAKYYNASGFSKENLQTLKYDVKQTYGITDAEVRALAEEEKALKKKQEKELAEIKLKVKITEDLSKFDFENADYRKELKPFAVEVSNALGHELPNMKTETLVSYLQDQKAKLLDVHAEELPAGTIAELGEEEKQLKKVLAEETPDTPEYDEKLERLKAVVSKKDELTEDAKNSENTSEENKNPEPSDEAQEKKKLREEFPFLNEKDCPDKFKILVADKFSALKAYHDAFEEIQRKKKAGDNEGLFELGKTATENWELNQLIYDELNYYQEHKQILGNHPIFVDDVLQKKVAAYSTQEAMKRQGNLRSYISRDTKKLEGIKDAKKKENAEAKIKEWQDELDLIDKRLNADAEKK